MGKLIDITGQKFGRLTVVHRVENDRKNNSRWLCRCDCGNEMVAIAFHLKSGNTSSCGCLHHDNHTTHGRSKTDEYKIWVGIINRCTNPNVNTYSKYGGRGIKLCDRWRTFNNFYADMGDRPTKYHSVERMNNDLGYNPDNCKWGTKKEQTINRRILKTNTSGYRGVRLDKRRSRWVATIKQNRKSIFLGHFKNMDDAIEARRKAEEHYWKSS